MNFAEQIGIAIADAVQLPPGEVVPFIEVPPSEDMGDYAFACFKLAKSLRMAPPAIAAKVSASIALPSFVERAEVAGGYVNFFLSKSFFASSVLSKVMEQGERYGSGLEGAGKTICIDYSSINIAKPFHIGHLSTTVIGNALYNIYSFLGYTCVGINHLGDWGTQFGKLIVAYKLWATPEIINKEGVRALLELYVKFHEEAKKDSALDDQARAWFKRIEDGDVEALELFDMFKRITMKEVSRVYDLLGVKFDSYAGESFYNDKMGRVIDECREKGLLTVDNGASMVVFDESENMPPCLLLKADGATLYATRDIAAAIYRKETYDFYKSLYVVAYQQNLHFKQFFKVVDMLGYEWAKDMEHIAFGMVSMEDGTLSTREGRVVFLEDLLYKAIDQSAQVIREKSPDLANVEETARVVGVGAIVFSTLSSGRIKDIVFSWDRALNFDGETAPYCQYTHARCCSVMRKAGEIDLANLDYAALEDVYAQGVLKQLERFGGVIRRACENNEPYMVTRFVVDLCRAYNKFYFENRILEAPANVKAARVALTSAAATVIKSGLALIGVGAPERM